MGLTALGLAPGWRRLWPLPPGMTLLCLALGLLWAGATGSHHLVYSTADWQIRDAVLRDLALGPWPVGYLNSDTGDHWLLRAPLGFYMPAGLVGNLAGVPAARVALWLWTGLGFGLVLMLIALLAREVSPARPGFGFALMVGFFIFFHGLDLLPNIWLDWNFGTGPLASWGRGGEWWPRLFQYTGHVTAILWAPNHAIPAWLVALLLLRHWQSPDFAKHLALPLAAGAFWSPLASAGAALLAVAVLLRQGMSMVRQALSLPNLLACLYAVPICVYLVAGAEEVPHGFLTALNPLGKALWVWALFLLLEVLCWALPAAMLVRGWPFTVAVVLLCLLPGYVFGPGNEMTARGGMAPLAVLAVVSASALLAPAMGRAQRAARALLIAFSVLAFAGATMEASLLTKKPWPASETCPLPQAAGQSVFAGSTNWSHYLVRWPEGTLLGLLREPQLRQTDRAGEETPCWPLLGP
ncbi:hypothetical protein ACHEVM_03835 [Roseomonas sp. SXEYE002]